LPEPPDAAVRKLTGEILARPEFASAISKEPFWTEWLRTFLKWLQKIQLLHDTSPVLYWTIVAAVAIRNAGLVVHIIWTLWIAISAPEPSARLATSGSAPDLAEQARSLAAAGRYLEAAHRLMIATFHALADRSIIELRPDRSNRWIRAALRQSSLASGLASEIDTLVGHTERRWFGRREDDPDIYTQWLSAFERLSAELR
jgi:hypothetical protein